jgi:hypothetical protein
MHEIWAKSFGDGKNPLPVGHISKNLVTKIFTKLNYTTLMTAWAEASAFA